MRPPYDDDPYAYDEMPVPRRRANCQVNQLSRIEGRDVHIPVGRGWKRTPLNEPIMFEMPGGVFEIVNLPPQPGANKPSSNLPPAVMAEAAMPASAHSTHFYH